MTPGGEPACGFDDRIDLLGAGVDVPEGSKVKGCVIHIDSQPPSSCLTAFTRIDVTVEGAVEGERQNYRLHTRLLFDDRRRHG